MKRSFLLSSCRHQEGRRGSDEVGKEPSVLPSRETGVWRTFGGCMKGVRYRFALQDPAGEAWSEEVGTGEEAKEEKNIKYEHFCAWLPVQVRACS